MNALDSSFLLCKSCRRMLWTTIHHVLFLRERNQNEEVALYGCCSLGIYPNWNVVITSVFSSLSSGTKLRRWIIYCRFGQLIFKSKFIVDLIIFEKIIIIKKVSKVLWKIINDIESFPKRSVFMVGGAIVQVPLVYVHNYENCVQNKSI